MSWRSGGFSGRLVSRRKRGTRPTSTRHTWTRRRRPARSISTRTGEASCPGRDLHRHVVEVVDRVALLLPAVGGEVLAEVALLVEEPHAHEGHAEVARALQVVGGEDAEAARVDRQALGEAVLGGEVGDERPLLEAPVPPGRLAQVGAQALEGPVVVGEEALVPGQGLEALLGDRAQHQHRVLVGAVPEVPVEAAEHDPQVVVPGPEQVVWRCRAAPAAVPAARARPGRSGSSWSGLRSTTRLLLLLVGPHQLRVGDHVALHGRLDLRPSSPRRGRGARCRGRTACGSSGAGRSAGRARRSRCASSRSCPASFPPAGPARRRPRAGRAPSGAGRRAPSGPRSSSGPSGPGASGSSTISTRLFAASGTPVQSRAGERSRPSQVKRAGISPPGAKAGELRASPIGSSPGPEVPLSGP